ncbi:MAG: hypothetical protein GXP47_07875 [Acidobacteria bacterium]|nr:hypothetical protein [Acidobacteriota bacterium]
MGHMMKSWLAAAMAMSGVFVLAAPARAAEADIVARVGNRVITRAELDLAVQRAVNSGYYHKRLPEAMLDTLRRQQLQALIHRQLDVLGARDRGLKPPTKDAEGRRAAMEIQLGTTEYERSLKANGWTREDHVRALTETLLGQEAYRRFVTEKAKVPEAAVRKAYDANVARWKMPPSLHLYHILLKVPPSADGSRWAKREAEARKIKAEAEAGTPFTDLAARDSEGMYRIKGGDLGWVHRGRLQPALEKAAWKATVGSIVGPIRTREGVHLLLVKEARPGRTLSFEEAAPMLRKELEKAALKRAEKRWYDEVQAKHPVVILDPALRQGEGGE